MTHGIVEREDLAYAGYYLFQLWEVDDSGNRTTSRCMAPVLMVAGQPDPDTLDRAKRAIQTMAREFKIEIISTPW
ncbi:MAG TPA: hypothetical protein VFZ25_08865 [Chloroflexota bacterium]|nr:hypothetical protein [Chloroflexota bacterium]